MTAFCLLNHELTQKQRDELHSTYGVETILQPPEDVSRIWAQMPADRELNKNTIEKIIAWLSNGQAGSIVVVQGEFGATFAIVDYALKKGLVPIYAATKRIAKETRNGEKVHREYIFEHVRFRKYRQYSELS